MAAPSEESAIAAGVEIFLGPVVRSPEGTPQKIRILTILLLSHGLIPDFETVFRTVFFCSQWI
uniref:Uncharacterized protein n=1 Tax=Equus asinus asinus TaxID=83772 RepID=A0A8C4LRQ5_EQUAS